MAKGTSERVNLDALIEREDFEREESGEGTRAGKLGSEIYLKTLTSDDRLAVLRKPDFQRETSSWSPEIVAQFIESVADGDVVPALIMWRSPTSGNTFIIDGAHRLSALAAWVNDDYGDGDFSKMFYGDYLSKTQIETAKKTRALVEDRVGKFSELVGYVRESGKAPSPVAVTRGQNILSNPLSVQPIAGDANAAELSYKRINSTAVAISQQELTLIDSRRLPTGIATRALMHAGTGYEYWHRFNEPMRSKIKETAALVYDQLVRPIVDYPVLALDLPTPKRGYSANSLNTILDLVTILNAPPSGKKTKVEADLDGSATLHHLEQVRRVTERVYGRKHSGSLALHPALYCYDMRGRFIAKAFIGAIEFVRTLQQNDQFYEFTDHRKDFEEFLLKHPYLMTQIGKSQGSGGRRGVPAVKALYVSLFNGLRSGKSEAEIIETMKTDSALSFLDWHEPLEQDAGEKFDPLDKAAVVIRTTLEKDICPECGGRLYIKDRSHDHTTRKQDGGKSVMSNIGLTHPYCNTGYKEAKRSAAEKGLGKND